MDVPCLLPGADYVSPSDLLRFITVTTLDRVLNLGHALSMGPRVIHIHTRGKLLAAAATLAANSHCGALKDPGDSYKLHLGQRTVVSDR